MKKFYHTGRSPRALWQRFRMWRAYRRPVTFYDLRKIAAAGQYPHLDPDSPGLPNLHRPEKVGVALFQAVIERAELPVFGAGKSDR